ncbi:MAG: hypothetical protein CEE40_06415 [Chloroflexi bacterium B3_Chlor]|nr:MAG: hypothetical protein CEE40_06415 [Chloroflexi bacterium B3_Chlor]
MASYGEYVMHRRCHGLRLEIHEPAYVVEENEVTLQRAMTFTVEPDIRLPCRGAPFPHILSSVAFAGYRRRAATQHTDVALQGAESNVNPERRRGAHSLPG